jgi:hypothetical protein
VTIDLLRLRLLLLNFVSLNIKGYFSLNIKGYYRDSARKAAVLMRSFVQFDGEGDAANAKLRAIGGHPAVLLRGVCLRKDPDSPYANRDGYVPFGKLVDYTGARSNGCTSWSRSDAGQIIPMVKDKPTTLYIHPKSEDIGAIAQAVAAGRSLSRAGLLERFPLERNRRSEILVKRSPRADPRSIQEGSSGTATAVLRRQSFYNVVVVDADSCSAPS